MIDVFSGLLEIVLRIITATVMTVIVVRLSPILFNFNPAKEIKEGNVAGGMALIGITLISALIAGLFRL